MFKKCLWRLAEVLVLAVLVHVATMKYGHYFYPAAGSQHAKQEDDPVSELELGIVHIIAIPEHLATNDEHDESFAKSRLIPRPGHGYVCFERGNMLKHRGFMFKLQPSSEGQMLN